MYSRITASSRPTVETKNPRAQKLWPTKFRFLSPYIRAMWIALLTLDEADHLRHRVFRRDQDQHVHVIRLQMPLLYPAFLLRGQLVEHFPKVLSDMPKKRLHPTLCNEHMWYLQSTWCDLSSHTRPSMEFPSCAWRLTRWSFVDGRPLLSPATPGTVKLLLPPRQSRGISLGY